MGNLVEVLFIVDEHTFYLQSFSKFGWGLVVACDDETFSDEIASDSTHTDATGAYEIDRFNIF
jgi:hypothetical protein